jgi:hypothetical protein
MDEIKRAYIEADPAVVKADAKLYALRSAPDTSRWGENRRFAGRMASNRLDRIDRAKASWSRAYDRAEARFDKLGKAVAAESRKSL